MNVLTEPTWIADAASFTPCYWVLLRSKKPFMMGFKGIGVEKGILGFEAMDDALQIKEWISANTVCRLSSWEQVEAVCRSFLGPQAPGIAFMPAGFFPQYLRRLRYALP